MAAALFDWPWWLCRPHPTWRKLGFAALAPADREQHYMPGMARQLGAAFALALR